MKTFLKSFDIPKAYTQIIAAVGECFSKGAATEIIQNIWGDQNSEKIPKSGEKNSAAPSATLKAPIFSILPDY